MGLKDALIRGAEEMSTVARRVPVRALEEATLEGARRAAAAEGAAVGLVHEARDLERTTERVAGDAERFAKIERAIVAEGRGLRTTAELAKGVTRPPAPGLEGLFRRFSVRDRLELGERAIRLARGKSVAEALRAENNMAGQLREVVTKYLEEVVDEVADVRRRLRTATAGSAQRTVIDSATHGAVELPTRMRGNNRFIRLGTDRIVGVGTLAPQRIPWTWSDGTKDLIEVAGELETSLAIEIKGRTTATGGVAQISALQQRGTRGYAIIGNKLWLVKYDPSMVIHLVVAPPGEELSAARKLAAALSASGTRTRAIAIPLALDNEVKSMARGYLAAAAGALP